MTAREPNPDQRRTEARNKPAKPPEGGSPLGRLDAEALESQRAHERDLAQMVETRPGFPGGPAYDQGQTPGHPPDQPARPVEDREPVGPYAPTRTPNLDDRAAAAPEQSGYRQGWRDAVLATASDAERFWASNLYPRTNVIGTDTGSQIEGARKFIGLAEWFWNELMIGPRDAVTGERQADDGTEVQRLRDIIQTIREATHSPDATRSVLQLQAVISAFCNAGLRDKTIPPPDFDG